MAKSYTLKRFKAGNWGVHIYCELYKCGIYFYPFVEDADYDRILTAWGCSGLSSFKAAEAKTITFTDEKAGSVTLILARKEVDASVLAHEAVHAVNYIFNVRGIVHGFDNDEHFAYLLEWLLSQLLESSQEVKKRLG